MGCLRDILLLTAVFVFSPFLSLEARGGMDASRDSEYLSRWAKYNQTGQYDSVIVAARPVLDSALLSGDSSTALMLSVMTAQAYMFTESEDSARYWIHMAEQECTQVYAARNLESETQYRIVQGMRMETCLPCVRKSSRQKRVRQSFRLWCSGTWRRPLPP